MSSQRISPPPRKRGQRASAWRRALWPWLACWIAGCATDGKPAEVLPDAAVSTSGDATGADELDGDAAQDASQDGAWEPSLDAGSAPDSRPNGQAGTGGNTGGNMGDPMDAGLAGGDAPGDAASALDAGDAGTTPDAADAADAGDADDASTTEPVPADCGDTRHGEDETRVRFATSSVPHGQSCTSELQRRHCTDGLLDDWSGSFTFSFCATAPPAPCGTTPHGGYQERTRYAAAAVPFGSLCAGEVQRQTCDDGQWSTWSGAFSAASCSIDPPGDCDGTPHQGQESRVFYEAATVPFGQACASEVQTRSCNDGAWGAWSGTFAHDDCTAMGPADCDATPHGGQQSRVRYAAATVPYGGSCQSEIQARSCSDGDWSAWSGSYLETDCSVAPPMDCGDTPHEGQETRVRYRFAHVASSASCESEQQMRQCTDGQLSAWSGSFTHATCAQCFDADGDGRGPGCALGDDCNDDEPTAYTGAAEVDWNDIDENCDGDLGKHLAVAFSAASQRLSQVHIDGQRVHAGSPRVSTRSLLDLATDLGTPLAYDLSRSAVAGGLRASFGASGELLLFDADDASTPLGSAPIPASGPAPNQPPIFSDDGQRVHVLSVGTDNANPSLLHQFDVSDPSAPALVVSRRLSCGASFNTTSTMQDRDGALTLVCNGWRGLHVYDVAGAGSGYVGGMTLPTTCSPYARSATTLYCTTGARVDLSDPLQPALLPSLTLGPAFSGPATVAAVDDGAFFKAQSDDQLCHASDGATAVDCTTLPAHAAELFTLRGASGDTLLLGWDAELVAYDVADRHAPVPRGDAFVTLPDARRAVLVGDVVLAAAGWGSGGVLLAYDLQQPAGDPRVVARIDNPISGAANGALLLAGTRLYVVGSRLSILDVTDPLAPALLSRGSWPPGGKFSAASGNALITQNGFQGLYSVDTLDAANPSVVQFNPFGMSANFGAMALLPAGGLFFRFSHSGGSGLWASPQATALPASFIDDARIVGLGAELLWTRYNAGATTLVVTDASSLTELRALPVPAVGSVMTTGTRVFVSNRRFNTGALPFLQTLSSSSAASASPVFGPSDTQLQSEALHGYPGRLLHTAQWQLVVLDVIEP